MKRRVLTGFTHFTDGDLDTSAACAVTGLTGNANFTFETGVLPNFKQVEDDYHSALGNLATGGASAVVIKT